MEIFVKVSSLVSNVFNSNEQPLEERLSKVFPDVLNGNWQGKYKTPDVLVLAGDATQGYHISRDPLAAPRKYVWTFYGADRKSFFEDLGIGFPEARDKRVLIITANERERDKMIEDLREWPTAQCIEISG